MQITSNFPGGNIAVDEIQGDTVQLHADLRDTEGDWFYWYFSVQNAQGRKIRFNFSGCRAMAANGPAISKDNGQTWNWLGSKSFEENSFQYTFGTNETGTRFASVIPYTESNWISFLSSLGDLRSLVEIRKIGFSRQGRPIEALHLGCLRDPVHRVVISARHHSCETMGSYTFEGLTSFLLSQDPKAIQLRERVEFCLVPFIDKDGVENGDQGKNRRPHDHNRDYAGRSIYPEVTAFREHLLTWSEGLLTVALDLHCPWIAYGMNEKVYMVGSRHPLIWEEQQRFGKILERVKGSSLPYRATNNLPFGHGWNIASNFANGRTFTDWAKDLAGVHLATTVEVPYSNASSAKVTPKTARALGPDLGRALAEYLKP
jgi:hypothetical protein